MLNMKNLVFIFLMIIVSGIASGQDWQNIKSVEDVCAAYPKQMKTMLSRFNLDFKGMEKVKQAYDSGNITEACKQLLEYYKNGNSAKDLRRVQPQKTTKTEALADTILKNVFVIQNVRGQVPVGKDGHRDWYYKGPNNDREWAWLSNRHSQLNHVFDVYMETGNPKYAKYIDLFLRDFIIGSMPYPGVKSSTSVWRGLEVSFRAKVWSRIFYGLLNSQYFSPATQLLILSSLPDHAHYNRNFHGGNNWLTMEISALATIATNFPEYKDSPEWLSYSIKTMTESMKGQVYPDGVQTELTAHYHNVALMNFSLFKDICDKADRALPDFFNQTIEKMWNYLAYSLRPNGYSPLNNDGDLDYNRDRIENIASKYKRDDWKFIASNGRHGSMPQKNPSYLFPWAGQLISRSGFDIDAQWSFFDIGPWGSGHQHNDKLHISISAYGRDLLVDAGRFAYTGEVAKKFRGYAKGTQGHNTVLIDGKGQKPDVRVADKPISGDHYKITPDFDYAWNSFDKYYDLEDVKHIRALFYVRGNFWVIVDKIETKTPRRVESLWHWHPDCEVEELTGNIVSTKNERGNLEIIPVGKTNWKIDMVKGREKPEIQGWYSEEYNKFEPNVATIYSTKIDASEIFVWLLVPSEKESPELLSKIISKNSKMVKLKVDNPDKGSWKITIPVAGNKKAKLSFSPVSK